MAYDWQPDVNSVTPSGISLDSLANYFDLFFMTRTLKDVGINLKSMPLGESDRLMTILTRQTGLIRAVAKGSRKQPSRLGGHMELFRVNSLVLAQSGRSGSLLRITQADTVQRFSLLSRSLARLTAAQYLAEVALVVGLTDHPQEELFLVVLEHLDRIEQANPDQVIPLLSHGLYHLLAIDGIAPQIQHCVSCGKAMHPDHLQQDYPQQDQESAFSYDLGGSVCEPCWVAHQAGGFRSQGGVAMVSGTVLGLMQRLPSPDIRQWIESQSVSGPTQSMSTQWLRVEYLLRRVLEFHSGKPIRSAELLELVASSPGSSL